MPAGDYLAGTVLLGVVLAAAIAGAVVLLRRRFAALQGVERLLAGSVLASAGLLAIHLVPAALGLLARGSVVVAALIWLGACIATPRAGPPAGADPPLEPPTDDYRRISWPLAGAAAVLAGLFVLAFIANQAIVPSTSADFMNFHLPTVSTWIQDGSLWSVESLLPAVAPGHYPNNGDAMVLVTVLPWHNDFMAHAAIWPFFVLTGVATYALALRLGAPRSPAVAAGALMLTVPVVAVAGLAHGITDSVMYFGFATGLLFLVRHHRTGEVSDLVLAGIALGISFGTKWYGVSAIVIVLVVWAAARLVAKVPWQAVMRQTAGISALVGLSGGIWLIRNLVESQNPVFPVKVAPFGVTLFDAPADVTRELAGFTIAGYLGDWDPWWKLEGDPELQGFVLDGILLQWWHSLAAPALLVVIGALAATLLIARRRPSGQPRGLLAAAAVAMGLIIVAYSVTPYTAGGPEGLPLLVGADSRYVVPALVLGAALSAWAAGRLRWGSVGFAVLALAAMVHGISWAGRGELAAADLRAVNWAVAVVIAIVVGSAAAWAVRGWLPRLRAGAGGGTAALVAAGGAVALVLVAGGQYIQKRFNDDRYRGADPVLDAVIANSATGRRIGLGSVWTDDGISPILPSYGRRFRNDVEYLGPVVDEMQRRYESRAEFVDALTAGDYDALILGRGRPEVARSDSREDDWARSAGWRLSGRSNRLELYLPPG